MSLEGLLGSILLLVLVLASIAAPFVRPTRANQDTLVAKQVSRANAYYERVLNNVRDLDEDFATGKIAPEEYQQERQAWLERGVRVLALMDELAQQHSLVSDSHADDAQIDAAIEAAIRQHQQTNYQQSNTPTQEVPA